MKSRSFLRCALPGVLAILTGPISAATVTWDNDSLDSLWDTAANWSGGAEPTAADDVVLATPIPGGLSTLTLALTPAETALSLTFQDNYTLSGGTLQLGAGGITTDAGVTASIGTSVNAASGLVKSGSGLLVLTGSNTVTGGTTVNAGTLRITSTGAVGGSTSNVVTVNAAAFEISGITLDRLVTANNGATIRGLGAASQNSGKMTVAAGATVQLEGGTSATDVFSYGNGSNDVSGGAGSLIVVGGTGAVRLGNASDYAGSWRADSGTLQLGSATALGNQSAQTLTLNGGTVAGRLASSTSFTGSAGNNVAVTANSTLVSDRSSAGAGLNYTFGALSIGTNTLTITAGAGATSGTGTITTGNVTLSGNATFAVNDGATAGAKLSTGSLIGGGVARTILKSGFGDWTITGGATDLIAGSQFSMAGGITEGLFPTLGAGASIAVAAAQNPFGDAAIEMDDGTLRFAADGDGTSVAQTFVIGTQLNIVGDVTLEVDRRTAGTNKTLQLPSLAINGSTGGTLNLSANNTYKLAVAGTTTITGPATINGTAGKTTTLDLAAIAQGAAGSSLTFGAAGTATVNLNGVGTYTGGTSVLGGTLNVNAAGAFGSGAISITGGTVATSVASAFSGATGLTLGGGVLTVRESSAMTGVPLSLNGGTLNLRSNTAATFAVGALSANGGTTTITVDRVNSGTAQKLSLPGVIDVTAPTTIAASVANTFSLGLGGFDLAADLTLSPATSAVVDVDGFITQDATARKLFKLGAGTVNLNGLGTFAGGTDALAGTLNVNVAGALGSGALNIAGGTVSTAVASGLVGLPSITMTSGALTLAEPTAVTGIPLTASGGTLNLRSGTPVTFGFSSIALTGGTTTFDSRRPGVTGGLALLTAGNSLTVSGSPTLISTGGNSNKVGLPATTLNSDFTITTTGADVVMTAGLSEDATPRKLIKTGASTSFMLNLASASTHTGGVEVREGIALVSHAAGAGTGAVFVGDTTGTALARLELAAGITFANGITVGAGSSGVKRISRENTITVGDSTIAGTVTLQDNVTIFHDSFTTNDLIVSGKVTGAFNITKDGPEFVRLTNATNDFGSGGAASVSIALGELIVTADGTLGNAANGVTLANNTTLIADGTFSTARTITLGGASQTIAVTSGNTLTVTGPFAGAGAVVFDNAGTIALDGVDNSARGTAASTALAVKLRLSGATSLSAAGPLTLGNTLTSPILELRNDASTAYNHPLTIVGNTTAIHVNRALAGSGTNGTHTLAAFTMSNQTLSVTGDNGYGLTLGAGTATGSATILNNAPGTLTIDSLALTSSVARAFSIGGTGGNVSLVGAITQGGAGAYSLTKSGSNTVTLGTGAGWTGATEVDAGVLDLNGVSLSTPALTIGGGVGSPELRTGTGVVTLGGNVLFDAGISTVSGLITGNLDLGGSTRTFTVESASGAVDLTVDGVISGSGGLTKAGSFGTFRMSGPGNSYSGLTTITGGEFQMDKTSGNAIGSGGLLVGGSGASTAATSLRAAQIDDSAPVTVHTTSLGALLDLNGFSETVGALTLTSSGSFGARVATGATGTLVLGGSLTLNNNRDSSNVSPREVLITGTGSGGTPTFDGTLDLGGVARTISVASTNVTNLLNAGGTIETVIINGGIVKTGARTLFLTNPANTFAGGVTIQNGEVSVPVAGALGAAGTVTLVNSGTDDATLTLSAGAQTIPSAVAVNGSGTGAGTIRFAGATGTTGTFSGTATLAAPLTFNVANGTPNSTVATLDYTGLLTDGAGTFGIVKTGGGTLLLAAGNTFSGGATIAAGTVKIANDSALGDAGGVTFTGSGLGGVLHTSASFANARDLTFTGIGNIRADAGVTAEFAGTISGAGEQAFIGSGTVIISGSGSPTGDLTIGTYADGSNFSGGSGTVVSYRGATALPTGNISIVNGGVLELGNGDLSRAFGTGAGQAQLPALSIGAGFAAFGANRTVNFGGAGAQLEWGIGGFLSNSSSTDLLFGSASATHSLTFQNALELNNTTSFRSRTIFAHDGPAAKEGILAGNITATGTGTTFLGFDGPGSVEVAGAISGNIDVDVFGSGTTTFSNAATSYTGDTYVELGSTLVLGPGITLAASDGLYITDATLDASAVGAPLAPTGFVEITGTLSGSVIVNEEFDGDGHITGDVSFTSAAPTYFFPYTTGTLAIDGALTLHANTETYFDFNSPIPNLSQSKVTVGGALTIAGTLGLAVNGASPNIGDTFFLFLNGGTDPISGTFAGLAEGANIIVGADTFQISYIANGDAGSVGNDIAVTTIVPEPSSGALLLGGLALLARRRSLSRRNPSNSACATWERIS